MHYIKVRAKLGSRLGLRAATCHIEEPFEPFPKRLHKISASQSSPVSPQYSPASQPSFFPFFRDLFSAHKNKSFDLKNIFAIAALFFFKQAPAGWGGGADASAYRFGKRQCVEIGVEEKEKKRIGVSEKIGLRNGKGGWR